MTKALAFGKIVGKRLRLLLLVVGKRLTTALVSQTPIEDNVVRFFRIS